MHTWSVTGDDVQRVSTLAGSDMSAAPKVDERALGPPGPTERRPVRHSRVLRIIAVERIVRGLLLGAGGVYLLSHVGSDFGRLAEHIMRAVELDPNRPFLHRIITTLHHLRAHVVLVTGIAAIGYGVLELVEGVGLWLDQLWAEFLTVIATSLLIPFEVYEVARKPSAWKAAGIAVNVAIVAYLAWRLHRRLRSVTETTT